MNNIVSAIAIVLLFIFGAAAAGNMINMQKQINQLKLNHQEDMQNITTHENKVRDELIKIGCKIIELESSDHILLDEIQSLYDRSSSSSTSIY